MGASLFFATRTGQKMLSEGRIRRIHTHPLYFLPAFMDVSRHRYPFVILVPLFFFFVFFFLPLDTNRLRGESNFRHEPLRKPPYEPSRVDIKFYYNFNFIRVIELWILSLRYIFLNLILKVIHRYTARIVQR